jgi:hypothetical protein
MIRAMTNPTRPCYRCRTWDDHPRHEIVGEPESSMHMDCCAEERKCAVCAAQIQRAIDATGAFHGRALGDTLADLPPVWVDHVPNDDNSDPHNLRTAELREMEV